MDEIEKDNENMDNVTENVSPEQAKADELGLNEFEDSDDKEEGEDKDFDPLGSTGDVSAIYNLIIT